jgi:hypothetical protein
MRMFPVLRYVALNECRYLLHFVDSCTPLHWPPPPSPPLPRYASNTVSHHSLCASYLISHNLASCRILYFLFLFLFLFLFYFYLICSFYFLLLSRLNVSSFASKKKIHDLVVGFADLHRRCHAHAHLLCSTLARGPACLSSAVPVDFIITIISFNVGWHWPACCMSCLLFCVCCVCVCVCVCVCMCQSERERDWEHIKIFCTFHIKPD